MTQLLKTEDDLRHWINNTEFDASTEIILFPQNMAESVHWRLVVALIKVGVIAYLDSKWPSTFKIQEYSKGSKATTRSRLPAELQLLHTKLSVFLQGLQITTPEKFEVQIVSVPQQPQASIDCGVYLLKFSDIVFSNSVQIALNIWPKNCTVNVLDERQIMLRTVKTLRESQKANLHLPSEQLHGFENPDATCHITAAILLFALFLPKHVQNNSVLCDAFEYARSGANCTGTSAQIIREKLYSQQVNQEDVWETVEKISHLLNLPDVLRTKLPRVQTRYDCSTCRNGDGQERVPLTLEYHVESNQDFVLEDLFEPGLKTVTKTCSDCGVNSTATQIETLKNAPDKLIICLHRALPKNSETQDEEEYKGRRSFASVVFDPVIHVQVYSDEDALHASKVSYLVTAILVHSSSINFGPQPTSASTNLNKGHFGIVVNYANGWCLHDDNRSKMVSWEDVTKMAKNVVGLLMYKMQPSSKICTQTSVSSKIPFILHSVSVLKRECQSLITYSLDTLASEEPKARHSRIIKDGLSLRDYLVALSELWKIQVSVGVLKTKTSC